MYNSTISCDKIRELYMKAYMDNKAAVDFRIAEGIEKNRKGDCKVVLTDKSGTPLAGKKVRINQTNHDFNFGANIFLLDEFDSEEYNAEYRELFKKHFNAATVPFYWGTLEPEENKPRYDKDSPKVYRRPAPDLCVEYCHENNIRTKLHCLVYDKFSPEWLTKMGEDEVLEKHEKRFEEIADRYTGKMFEFEVINEILQMYFWNRSQCSTIYDRKDIGEWAFKLARKYFPNEKLVINEGNPFADISEKKHFSQYYMLIENLILKGAEIDKIGIQHHLFTGVTARTQEEYDDSVGNYKPGFEFCNPIKLFKMLDSLSDFNLPLEITEITIPTFGDSEEFEQLQADMLKLWYSVFFSHPLVDTAIYWNTADGYTYDDPNVIWNENNCRGGLWRHDLTPKKSANMLYDLTHNVWHTELELTTDENGAVEFRGFYGDYEVEIDGETVLFGNHKYGETQTVAI